MGRRNHRSGTGTVSGTRAAQHPSPSGIVTADIELLATGPEVIDIDPANHASNMALGASIWRDRSGALVAGVAAGAGGIQLVQLSPPGAVPFNSPICPTLAVIDAQY
ncbi:MAG: hypothetical protein HY699_18620, partial [Deltaproteobacteria bacterium]|nr:hypothetical protein [Deltaproteobacteria bacterium]